MKTKIVFDLDGVLRGLSTSLRRKTSCPPITNWWWKYKDKDIYDYVKEDYSILTDAPTTKYFNTIKELHGKDKIEIWSHQPESWIPYTKKWLNKHLKNKYILKIFNPKDKYRELHKERNTLLVEDNPNFESYNKIILIDYPYNRAVNAHIRIKHPSHLKNILESYK